MATNNPNFTPPTSTVFTELWYAVEEDTGLKQIFGIQGIPQIVTSTEDITYRTLESDTEFATKGVRPYETIEIQMLHYHEQYEELKQVESGGKLPWWYIKLPDSSAPEGSKPITIKWRGSLSIALDAIDLDGMNFDVLTIGKSTVPEMLEGLPQASGDDVRTVKERKTTEI